MSASTISQCSARTDLIDLRRWLQMDKRCSPKVCTKPVLQALAWCLKERISQSSCFHAVSILAWMLACNDTILNTSSRRCHLRHMRLDLSSSWSMSSSSFSRLWVDLQGKACELLCLSFLRVTCLVSCLLLLKLPLAERAIVALQAANLLTVLLGSSSPSLQSL